MLLLDTIVTFIIEIWKIFSLRLSKFYGLEKSALLNHKKF